MAPFDHQAYLESYIDVLRTLECDLVESIAQSLFRAWAARRTVFCCGNGGSAASAGHFIADLTKLTAPRGGHRLRAMALTESAPALTAIANDFSYADVFVEQLQAFLEPGDVVIGFSTSGSSPNVLRAVEYGNARGALTVGITGRNGTALGRLAQRTLFVNASSVQQIEDATMVVGHLLCLHVKTLIAEATEPTSTMSDATLPTVAVATSRP